MDGKTINTGPLRRAADWIRRRPHLVLILFAACLRTAAAASAVLVHNDSAIYMEIARRFHDGRWAEALSYDYHPLPSLLIAAFRIAAPSLVSAGYASSVFFSSLAVLPLYFLAKDVLGARPAFAACVAYAAIPAYVSFGSSVLSEGPYYFFFILSLWAIHSALALPSVRLGMLAGLSAAFAYLCRPEGGGLMVLLVLWAAFLAIRLRSPASWRIAASAALGVAVFSACSVPYMIHIKEQTGRWEITKKKKISILVGTEEADSGKTTDEAAGDAVPGRDSGPGEEAPPDKSLPPVPEYEPGPALETRSSAAKVAWSFFATANTAVGILFYVPPLIGLLGFFMAPPEGGRRTGKAFLLSVIALYGAVCWLLLFTHGYLSSRHLSAALICTMPFIGAGLICMGKLSAAALKRFRGRDCGPALEYALAALLVALFAALCLPRALRPFGAEKRHLRDIGEALAGIEGEGHRIMSSEMRVPVYAAGEYVPMPGRDGLNALRDSCLRGNCRMLVVNYGAMPFLRDYPKAAAALWKRRIEGFEKILEFDPDGRGRPIVAFRVEDAEGNRR